MSNENDNKQEENAPATVEIEVGHIKSIVNIIDTVQQRGVFKGEEMLPIGALRQTLINLIQ